MIAKVIHFCCPACEQPVEADAVVSGRLISCPSCGREFNPPAPARKLSLSWLIVSSLGVVVLVVFAAVSLERALSAYEARHPRPETAGARLNRLQTEARSLLLPECTNAIVGFHRVIDQDITVLDPDPDKWSAQVTAEFVNRMGGIERTNVPFAFAAYKSAVDGLDHVLCRVDLAKISQTERDALHRKFGLADSNADITPTN